MKGLKDKIENIVENFKKLNILVIGDVMLDKYTFGEVSRISPEAPIPVLEVKEQRFVPGGAANVASNITSFNAKCSLIGIVGNDESKKILLTELEKRKINVSNLITDKKRRTIVKERIIAKSQQMIRVDFENKEYIHFDHIKEIIKKIGKTKYDAIIVSDYAKGMITHELLNELKKLNVKIIVDTKPLHKKWYKDVFAITPNEKEAREMSASLEEKSSNIEDVGNYLKKELNANVLMTRGQHGISLFEKGESKVFSVPTKAKEVYDVSGAGDTVIAVYSLAVASNIEQKTAAVIANHAGGIKVKKLGTATVSASELIKDIKEDESYIS